MTSTDHFALRLFFMHDNTPSHAAKATTSFLESQGFVREILMTWPPCSADLNPTEHLLAILKRGVYKEGEQFPSKNALSEAKLFAVARAITPYNITDLLG